MQKNFRIVLRIYLSKSHHSKFKWNLEPNRIFFIILTQFWIFFFSSRSCHCYTFHSGRQALAWCEAWYLSFWTLLNVRLTSIAEKDEISTHCCHSQYWINLYWYIAYIFMGVNFICCRCYEIFCHHLIIFIHTMNVLSHGQANDDDDEIE